MGNRNSQSLITKGSQQFLNQQFQLIEEGYSSYFGNYQIIRPVCKHQTFMKRALFFQDHQSLKEFIEEAQKIKETKFNLIQPKKIIENHQRYKDNNSIGLCSLASSLIVFHKNQNKSFTLFEKVRENSLKIISNPFQKHSKFENILFSQTKLWFLLNQISRSIQILIQRKHCHWNILPETIYYNNNQNWFIHESYFILGPNTQEFLQKKNQQKAFMSQQLKKRIQFGIISTFNDGIEEDVYCLGHCLIYAITGVHPKDISKSTDMSYERQFKATKLLQKKKSIYSKQILDLIKKMICSDSKKRMNIRQLRYILKQKEILIIQEQEKEYIEIQANNSLLYQKEKSRTLKDSFKFKNKQVQGHNNKLNSYKCQDVLKPLYEKKQYLKTQYYTNQKFDESHANNYQKSQQNIKTVKKFASPQHYENYSQLYGTSKQINMNINNQDGFQRQLSPKYNRSRNQKNTLKDLQVSIVTQTPIRKILQQQNHMGFNSPQKYSASSFKINYYSPQKKYI